MLVREAIISQPEGNALVAKTHSSYGLKESRHCVKNALRAAESRHMPVTRLSKWCHDRACMPPVHSGRTWLLKSERCVAHTTRA